MFPNDVPDDQFSAEALADNSYAEVFDNDILSTNWQMTAAVGLTVASGGVLGALSLAAFPAQTIATVTGIGTLAYAGKRRADGKAAFPFMDKKSDETESTQEATPEVAAA